MPLPGFVVAYDKPKFKFGKKLPSRHAEFIYKPTGETFKVKVTDKVRLRGEKYFSNRLTQLFKQTKV